MEGAAPRRTAGRLGPVGQYFWRRGSVGRHVVTAGGEGVRGCYIGANRPLVLLSLLLAAVTVGLTRGLTHPGGLENTRLAGYEGKRRNTRGEIGARYPGGNLEVHYG